MPAETAQAFETAGQYVQLTIGEEKPGFYAIASAPGKAWITLQYLNQVCLIDVKTMKVEVSIKCPRSLADGRGPIGGPHCARECHGHLYLSLIHI